MIILKLKPWIPINGLLHTGTSWQVSTDPYMQNNIIYDVSNDIVNKDILYTTLPIEDGTVYYGRSKRHFSNGGDNGWTDVVMGVYNATDSQIMIDDKIVVEQPIIIVDEDALYDNNVLSLTINTTEFRSTAGTHYSTHWYVRLPNGEIIYSKLDDTENLTSITISKAALGIYGNSEVIITAIHVATPSIVSAPGEYTMSRYANNYNYRITNSNLVYIKPDGPYDIIFKKVDISKALGVASIVVLEAITNKEVYAEVLTTNQYTVTLPKSILKEDSDYILKIKALANDGLYSVASIPLGVGSKSDVITIDNGYVYKDEIIKVERSSASSFYGIRPGSNIECFYNNLMPYVTSFDTTVDIESVRNDGTGHTNISSNNMTDGGNMWLPIVVDGPGHIRSKLLEDGTLMNIENSMLSGPSLRKGIFNPIDGTLKYTGGFSGTLDPLDTHPLLILNDVMYYVSKSQNIMYKYNVRTGTTISSSPTLAYTIMGTSIIDIGNDKIMFVGVNEYCVIYDITSNVWSEGPLLDTTYANNRHNVCRLINGNYRFFIHRDDVASITEYEYLEYNVMSNTFKRVTVDDLTINDIPDSFITTTTGVVIALRQTTLPDIGDLPVGYDLTKGNDIYLIS